MTRDESEYIRDLRRRLAAAEAARDRAPTLDEIDEAKTVVRDLRQGRVLDLIDLTQTGFSRHGEFSVYTVRVETNLPLTPAELRKILHRGVTEKQRSEAEDDFRTTGMRLLCGPRKGR
jgi:hypothetical protein